jgi:hypothetical protein
MPCPLLALLVESVAPFELCKPEAGTTMTRPALALQGAPASPASLTVTDPGCTNGPQGTIAPKSRLVLSVCSGKPPSSTTFLIFNIKCLMIPSLE